MKYLSVLILGFAMIGCNQKTYYDANNRNIQKFHTEIEERNAKYLLELNDDLMLVKFVATHTKQQTNSDELYEQAAKMEKLLKKVSLELQKEALIQNVALSSQLSQKNDKIYGQFQATATKNIEAGYNKVMEEKLAVILKKTEEYLTNGNNERIQKLSLEVKNDMADALEIYS